MTRILVVLAIFMLVVVLFVHMGVTMSLMRVRCWQRCPRALRGLI